MSPITRGISYSESLLYSLHRLIDAAIICLHGRHCAASHGGCRASRDLVTIAATSIVVHHVIADLSGLYRSWRGTRLQNEIVCVFVTWAYTVPVLLGLGLVTQYNAEFSYSTKLVWIFATPAAMALARDRDAEGSAAAAGSRLQHADLRRLRRERPGHSAGPQHRSSSPEIGLRLAGFYDDRPVGADRRFAGRVRRSHRRPRRTRPPGPPGHDRHAFTSPSRCGPKIASATCLERLADSAVSVYIVPDFFVFELLHARWSNVGGLPTVSVFENPLYGVDGLLKRTGDLVLGSLMLAAAAIPMLIIAILVKLSSPGPVFFRQKRYGLDGREILVWKFRSMKCCDNGSSVKQATQGDDRITPIGRDPAADVARRVAAIVQRDRRHDVAGRPAAARQRPQRSSTARRSAATCCATR